MLTASRDRSKKLDLGSRMVSVRIRIRVKVGIRIRLNVDRIKVASGLGFVLGLGFAFGSGLHGNSGGQQGRGVGLLLSSVPLRQSDWEVSWR